MSAAGAGSVGRQQRPMSGKMLKKHASSPGWGKRILELDNDLGILYVYKSDTDRQRKTPAHLYALADMESVEALDNGAVSHCIVCRLRLKPGEVRPTYMPSAVTSLYGCSSAQEQTAWVDSLSARIATARKRGARHLEVPIPDTRGATLDVELKNWDNQPIGVMIHGLSKTSPLSQAGLVHGDVIISVDDQACLSHKHAVELLEGQTKALSLIVWQSNAAPKDEDDDEEKEEAVAVT